MPLDGLIVASPANPTGTMIRAEQLATLTAWCADNGVRLISDEIYHGITADGSRGSCAWTHDRRPVVVSSFSKFWGMTGWRLGWALIPEDLLAATDALAGNYALCPPVPAQHAAICAFTPAAYAEAQEAAARFAAAREVALARIPDLGWTDVAPADGAFYLYASLADRLGPYRTPSPGARHCWRSTASRSRPASTSIGSRAGTPYGCRWPPARRRSRRRSSGS